MRMSLAWQADEARAWTLPTQLAVRVATGTRTMNAIDSFNQRGSARDIQWNIPKAKYVSSL